MHRQSSMDLNSFRAASGVGITMLLGHKTYVKTHIIRIVYTHSWLCVSRWFGLVVTRWSRSTKLLYARPG